MVAKYWWRMPRGTWGTGDIFHGPPAGGPVLLEVCTRGRLWARRLWLLQ